MQQIAKRNTAIDIVRIITCPFIVFIHCPLPGILGQLVIHIGRYGVPFFLLLSGWFSYDPSEERMLRHAKKKLLDTVRLVGIFFAAYAIMNPVASLLSGGTLCSWLSKHCTVRAAAYFVLFNRGLFFGSTGYYPLMLIYVYIIYMILVKYHVLEKAFPLIPILLAAHIFLSKCTDLSWFFYGNFLFTGLPFFLLGHWLHKKEGHFRWSRLTWILVFFAGAVCSVLEAFLISNAYCYIGTVFMATALLMLCVRSRLTVGDPAAISFVRQCSVYVFILHCGLRDILQNLLDHSSGEASSYMFPLLVLAASCVVSILWVLLGTKLKKGSA